MTRQLRTETLTTKQNRDLIKNCAVLFGPKTEESHNIEAADRQIFMDASNCSGFIPKNTETLDLLRANFELNGSKCPVFDYNKQPVGPAKFSSEFLRVVLEITKHYPTVAIQAAKDFPLTIETPDFIFIIAPRVDNDD